MVFGGVPRTVPDIVGAVPCRTAMRMSAMPRPPSAVNSLSTLAAAFIRRSSRASAMSDFFASRSLSADAISFSNPFLSSPERVSASVTAFLAAAMASVAAVTSASVDSPSRAATAAVASSMALKTAARCSAAVPPSIEIAPFPEPPQAPRPSASTHITVSRIFGMFLVP